MANKSLKQRMRIPPETSAWFIKSLIQCGKLEIMFHNLTILRKYYWPYPR